MTNSFDHTRILKCAKCFHSGLCMQNFGGTDLDSISTNCSHYSEAVEIPKSIWIIFDVPGFYDVTEYQVERVLYVYGELSRLWVANRNSETVVHAHDFGKTAFFTKEEAQARIDYLIEERHNEKV